MAHPELRFCPRCVDRMEWRATHYPGIEHPVCLVCGFVLWQNPKPSVEALIVRDGESGPEMSRRPAHVAEMALTSALIPALSVYWRLRGALKHRVLFA